MGWAAKYAKDLRKRAAGGNGDDPKQKAQEEAPAVEGKAALGFTLELATQQQARCLKVSNDLYGMLSGRRIMPGRFDVQAQLLKNQILIMQTLATMLDLQIYRATGTTNIRPRTTQPAPKPIIIPGGRG